MMTTLLDGGYGFDFDDDDDYNYNYNYKCIMETLLRMTHPLLTAMNHDMI